MPSTIAELSLEQIDQLFGLNDTALTKSEPIESATGPGRAP